jgi:CHAD domain-containing protein
MVQRPSSRPPGKGTVRAGQAQSRRLAPALLTSGMACNTAFRIVAGRCLSALTANHRATCAGDAGALHQMRIALTRLRTAITFFSPMVAGPQRTRLRSELKWLNTHLGVVRDLDVAIEWLKATDKRRPREDYRSWSRERAASQQRLARVLRSARYRRLVESISRWIERGSWSTRKGRQAASERACPVSEYSARKLTRWRQKLIKKSRGLGNLDTGKRHRLRLLNKKLSYAIESIADLVPDSEISRQQATLKALRKAQRSLGRLNDDARCRSLATNLGRGGAGISGMLLGPRREKHLLRTAAAAYEKLSELKPFRI